MDNFINLAKQGYQAYESSQGGQNTSGPQQQQQGDQGNEPQYNIQGGAQYNSSDHQNAPSANIDQHQAVQQASSLAGNSGDSGLFSQAMSFVNNNQQQHTQPVDEQGVQQAHDAAYNQGNASSLDAGGIGGAAAMQALKMFTSGGGGSGGSQTQLISSAMSEASKLFDASGGGAGGSKQDAVSSAGMTVMKLLVQSKFSGMMGGSNSGGMSGLMGMASQFL